MPILTERVGWKRHRPPKETDASSDLSPEEQAHAKAAIRFLGKRFGSYGKLAEAMRAKRATVISAVSARGAVSAGVALRAARAADVPLEDVLAGRWPTATMCPYCGRG
ncbi:MAG TPA: hypothetical protein VKU41_31300 [Polyangiaceae bacterium]|nr:hypothetical protein [Polyangiaceae bacterium]